MDYLKSLLGADEEVLFRTRKHWFVLVSETLKEALMLGGMVTAGIFLTPVAPWAWAVFGALSLLVLVSMTIDILRWRNQEFLVTNRRVIQSAGIFNKTIVDSSLNKINDVILEQSWTGRIMNYGTIRILTATEDVINLFSHIHRPIQLKRAMLDARNALEGNSHQPAATATQLLEELGSLRERNLISEEEFQEKRKEILRRM